MQADVWQAIRHIAALDLYKEESSADKPDDFGFYHPADVVLDVWMQRKLHGILPEAGGWLDQSEAWRHDLSTCDRLYNAAAAEVKDGIDPAAELLGEDAGTPMTRMFN